jgi:AbrB family looped-hinge helix DNA binding protein
MGLTAAMANGIFNGMKKSLKVDAAGRVVLPQPVRRHFHLEAGAMLDLEVNQETIILRPRSRAAALVEEDGLLVHDGEPSGELLGVVEAVRRRRDRDTAGPVR